MAGNAGAIRAGAAYVELFLKDNRLVRGLARNGARLRRFGASIMRIGAGVTAAGAAITAPILAAAKAFASAGDALDKMSARVGASVPFLSALGHAAVIGGTDINAMEVGIRRMQRTAYDASRGLSTATEAFGELGVEIRGADGQLKSTEALFMESATALSKMTNNTKKAAIATVVFGRAGTQLRGIAAAMKAGDIKLAAEILWAEIRLQFQKGVNALYEIWVGFKQKFMDGWTDLSAKIGSLFVFDDQTLRMLEEDRARANAHRANRYAADLAARAKELAALKRERDELIGAATGGRDYSR